MSVISCISLFTLTKAIYTQGELIMTTFTPTTELGLSIQSRIDPDATTIRQLSEGRSDLYKVNPFSIQVAENFNVRDFDTAEMKEHVDQLALSISANGLETPLKVRMKNGKITLVDGECRLRGIVRAIEEYGAEIRSIPVMVAAKGTNDAEASLSVITANAGKPITSLQTAIICDRLVNNFGWSPTDVAAKIGKTEATVNRYLELNSMPECAKKMVKAGKISVTLAHEVSSKYENDDEKVKSALSEAAVVAEESGKSKITKRSVTASDNGESTIKKPTFKQTVISSFEGVQAEILDDDDGVVMTFTNEQAQALSELLGISLT